MSEYTFTLKRMKTQYVQTSAEPFTLGELTSADFSCFTVEDEVRPEGEKVPGLTAIPAGRYELKVTMSNRFKRNLPLLVGVPNFEGVRIHGGNKAENSEGCVIVGTKRTPDGVCNCAPAVDAIIRLIELHDSVWIEVLNADD